MAIEIELMEKSPKSALIALLLALFAGPLGLHRFYVGKIITGILYIFTGGILGIGIIVDLVLIVMGKFRDFDDRVLEF
ncbi:MAG: TM2 domain-containing protein [Oscillospiraceae bacterium]|jgi:TM2 domain-containing membrane protein YozV|nr:TM2 domain-containing protein [Oscillospiraceae bacterium]